MSLFKNLVWVSAAAILGACSSNEKIEAEVESPTNGFDSEGNGYINIAINMPGGGGSDTRADAALTSGNDQFADGDEYEVENAALLLFTNTTDDENSAKFVTAYKLDISWTSDASDVDQITKQGSEVKRITDDGNTYKYALVALNYENVFTVQTDNTIQIGSKKFTGTFQEFSQQLASASEADTYGGFMYSKNEKSYFFMTNTVLANAAGTGVTGSTYSNSTIALAKVADENGSYIYKTEDAAKQGNAIDVIVERALAKVQLTVDNTKVTSGATLTGVGVQSTTTEGYDVLKLASTPVVWKLNNKNKSSYFVRNWAQVPANGNATVYGDQWLSLYSDGDGLSSTPSALSSNKYRFAGTNKIAHSEETPGTGLFNPKGEYYRTYWCVDPNYEKSLYDENVATYDDTDYANVGTAEYCFENTFDINHQTHKNTTLAMVKVQFELGKSSVSNNETTTASATDDTEPANTFYVISNVTKSTIYTKDALVEEIKKDPKLSGKSNVAITFGKEATSGTTTSTLTAETAGKIVITGLTFESNSTDDNKSIIEALNKNYTIERYPGGVAYYPILIKHFGDDLTPWNSTDKTTSAYPAGTGEGKTANDRWLGRYGVVRNNWYLLNITGIESIGYSEPPTPDETTDDEIDSWINVRVTMLSWAKRQQDIKL